MAVLATALVIAVLAVVISVVLAVMLVVAVLVSPCLSGRRACRRLAYVSRAVLALGSRRVVASCVS